jgi:CRISPR/Cas system-associated endoribonuclease Cas2
VNEKKPNVKPVNEKKPNVKPVNEKKPNVKPVNNKKPNNNAPNVKPVNEKKPNVKPQEPKVNKFANQKTLSKYLQNLGMKRGNRKTFMARLGKNKLENIQSNAKKFMNDKKKPNVKPQEPKVNKFANQKTLSKYLQNLGMNRGNRKTFMARLGKNKLENIQSNAKKFMNDKKKPNVKPQEPKVNKFANQKVLSKYLQNVGMNRGNRKTFMARLKSEKLNAIKANVKKFMNAKKEPKVNKFANQKVLSKYLQNVGMNRGNRKTFMARLKSEKLNAIKANVKKFMNAKKEPKVNKFANQKVLSKYLQNVGMNRGNRKTFMARLKSEKLNAIKANAKKFMNKPKELSNTDKGVRWKLFNSPKYNKLTTKEREDLFKRWMNKKNKTIWANAQKLQASRTKSIVPVKTNAPKAKPVTATNMKKEFQNLMKSKGVSADSAFKRLSLKYHPNKGGKQENFIRLQSIRDELKTTKNTGRQSLLNRINKNVPRETNFSQGRMKWKSAIKAAKNSELAKIKQLLDNKLKLKKNVESTVKNAGKKKQLLHQLMAYKNDTATRRKQMLALPAPKPVNKFANQKALSKHLQNLKMNRSDRTKFVARLKTQKLNVIKANAKKFMNAKARASAKAKANAKRKANNNARREREKKARIAKASQPRVAPKTKKGKAKYRKRR